MSSFLMRNLNCVQVLNNDNLSLPSHKRLGNWASYGSRAFTTYDGPSSCMHKRTLTRLRGKPILSPLLGLGKGAMPTCGATSLGAAE